MTTTYVFVGTSEMVKAGKPFVVADDKKRVTSEGLKLWIRQIGGAVALRSSRRAKVFRCANGDTYRVHAWVQIS